MDRPDSPLSIADLSAAGVRLRPYEAVTIVRELVLQVIRGEVAGVPSSPVIRLSASGAISVEGPVDASGRPIVRAAQLLDSLLPSSLDGHEFRVPGGLKLVVARALGTLDLPPFSSLADFAEGLTRFAAREPGVMVSQLVVSWAESVAGRTPGGIDGHGASSAAAQVGRFVASRPLDGRRLSASNELTVSDIRRARRATGMPLIRVAERSRIPLKLLRQLEWGYLLNWPTGHYGRTQLVRYARATGLDEQLVVATIQPLIEQAASRRAFLAHRAVRADELVAANPAPEPIVTIEEVTITHTPPALPWPQAAEADVGEPRTLSKVLAALAIPALLAIGLLPAWWAYSVNPSIPELPSVKQQVPSSAPAPEAAAQLRREAETVSPGGNGAAGSPADALIPSGAREAVATDSSRSGAYRLASDSADAFSPAFASIGTAMFYHPEDDRMLTQADSDSRGAVLRITRIVDDAATNFHVRPSPDGRRIAFDSDRGGVRGIYVADADGRNVRRVSPEGFAAVPSWSPDGSTLAFAREEPYRPDVWNLWTIDLSTGELSQVTKHQDGQLRGASWFRDNRRIAYSHGERLVIHDLESGEERVFASPRKGRALGRPAVSPDGERVIFQVQRDGAWILELADGSVRKVLDDGTAEEYTWSPDGRRVAYYSARTETWGIWVLASR
jgi:hypothetical protein